LRPKSVNKSASSDVRNEGLWWAVIEIAFLVLDKVTISRQAVDGIGV
jgi:hypothetical protein